MVKPRIDFGMANWPDCPRWGPRKLDWLLLKWLQNHFADAGNIYMETLRERIYKAGETFGIPAVDTALNIASITAWDPKLTEKRPALITKQHELQILRQGIGADRLMGGDPGKQLYSTLLAGGHTTYCISRAAGECQDLA